MQMQQPFKLKNQGRMMRTKFKNYNNNKKILPHPHKLLHVRCFIGP